MGRLVTKERATYRHRYPDEHSVSPHCDGFDHRPALADARIAQGSPEHYWHADTVRIHQPDGSAEQRKVVLDRVGRQVGDDGVGERGRDEEREYERCECPERPVEVRRGREVGGGVRGRKRVERIGTAEEDLYIKKGLRKLLFAFIYHFVDARFWCRRRNGVGSSRHSRKMRYWRQRCSLKKLNVMRLAHARAQKGLSHLSLDSPSERVHQFYPQEVG